MAKYVFLDAEGTLVFDRETRATVPVDGTWQSEAYRSWLDAGNVTDPLPPPTFQDYVAAFTPGLQAWMEATAHSNAYDSVLSCVSYKDSGVAQFAADAAAMIAWRDAVWKWASAWQAGFNGQLPEHIPTIDAIIALAPQPKDFGWVVHDPGRIIESQAPAQQ